MLNENSTVAPGNFRLKIDGRTDYLNFYLVHGDEPLFIGDAVPSRAKNR